MVSNKYNTQLTLEDKTLNSMDHLEFFKHKINNNIPFSIVRPGDGEYAILNKNNLKMTQDGWSFETGGKLPYDLKDSLQLACQTSSLYFGIPCKGCNNDMSDWFTSNFEIPPERMTYSNVFCNANWKEFINIFKNNRVPFYYIGPGNCIANKLNCLDVFPIDPLLVNNWDKDSDSVIENLKSWVNCKRGIFLISAGPIAKILVPILTKMQPLNSYIDVGSSLDSYSKLNITRPYLYSESQYSKMICSFENGHFQNTEDISVVLTLFKRPHCLVEQLQSIQSQTKVPKEIIILKNHADGIELPEIPPKLLRSVKIVDSEKNFGVWGRFAIALLCNTEYICVFDDDTIPGKSWFDNCLQSMKIREGLYGTIGIKFHSNSYYGPYHRVGWDCPNNNIEQVDIVGHSWFLKRKWLCQLWSFVPDYDTHLKCGEDINLSFYLQKINIPTLVPPHPKDVYELYGSIPSTAMKYGTDKNAISVEPTSLQLFDACLQNAINSGFVLLHSGVPTQRIDNSGIPTQRIDNSVSNISSVYIGKNLSWLRKR
jgi:Glycosyl transferase family 2